VIYEKGVSLKKGQGKPSGILQDAGGRGVLFRPIFRVICLFVLGLCSWSGTLEAQYKNFKPFTLLRVIRTEHFEIIFPRESEATAQALAGIADGCYDRISALLGITLDRRIPVSISPHTDQFNGYMNPLPYPHIVLYDTPMNIESTAYEDALESLFFHELTHAVSLSSRSPFFKVLHNIFGGWVYPTGLTAPQFMIEGVAVSFESLDGFGRARDPLVRAKLRQALYEGRFLTPFEAAGAYDLPPGKSAYYDYGGPFSEYLQRKYGMEKYAELWQAMGGEYHFSFFFYNNGFFYSFKRVYGIPFLEAWDDFKEEFRFPYIEDTRARIIRGGRSRITGLASGGGKVFALDQLDQKVVVYDPLKETVKTVAKVDHTAYDLAASPGGDRLLVSSYRVTGGLARTVVTEYDAVRGWQTMRNWEGLYHGRYFRDGVIGLRSDRHTNTIVFTRPSGEEEVLLRGNASILYSHPTALDDTWIVFTVAKGGIRELCLYNYDTWEIYSFESLWGDDEDYWRYIRGLGVSEGHILFSFNHNDGMYKLGMVDLSALRDGVLPDHPMAFFAERELSGGVYLPVMAQGELFYRGAFSTWDALMKYPDSGETLWGSHVPLQLRPWDNEDWTTTGVPPRIPSTDPEEFRNGDSPVEGSFTEKSTGYFPLSYFNPFKLWIPTPLIRTGPDSVRFDGAGFFSFIVDPTDTNWIFLNAAMDIRRLMADVNLHWINTTLGTSLDFQFADTILTTAAYPRRKTTLLFQAPFRVGLEGERLFFNFALGGGISLYAPDPLDNSYVYTWKYGDPVYSAMMLLGFSSRQRYTWDLFGRGIAGNFYARFPFDTEAPHLELQGEAAFLENFLPLKLTLYGALDDRGMDIHGGTKNWTVSGTFDNVAAGEYRTDLYPLIWLWGGEGELGFFSMDINRGLSHLYSNRISSTLAYRWVFFDGEAGRLIPAIPLGDSRMVHSLVLRLKAVISTIAITAAPLKITPELFGILKLSVLDDPRWSRKFTWGFNISATF
jgi:hypothetical protein